MNLSIQSFFYSLWIINICVLVSIILLERKRPEKTLAWLLIFIVFPPLGLILYIFLGRNWKLHTLNKGLSRDMKVLLEPVLKKSEDNDFKTLMTLIANTSESPVFLNNEISIFNNGVEKFDKLKAELMKATHHIHLEYYIVKDDDIGREIKDILILKAKEGVKVRFIIDKVGSIKLPKSYVNELRENGVIVAVYSYFLAPILKHINTQINYRNHRKIVIIDGKVGFLGGINIGDEYLNKGKLGYWRDTHMMIRGEGVLGLQAVFLDDFLTIEDANKDYSFYESDFEKYFPMPKNCGSSTIQLAVSGPNSPYSSIMQSVLKLIYLAKDHIYIETPYFVPPESIIEALKVAALSGVNIKLIVPSVPDHLTVFLASKTYLAELVDCGAEVYGYKNSGFLHSKTITVDGIVSSLGTANMDIRSYELNYEINSIIYDTETTKLLDNDFFMDLENSRPMTSEEFHSSNKLQQMIESIARIFSAIL